MAISLLDLESGQVSLEFAAGDRAAVRAALADLLGPTRVVERAALYDLVAFGEEHFLYYHEWDPCLISTSPSGVVALRHVALARRP